MAFRKIAFGAAAMSSVVVFRLLGQLLVVPLLSRLLSPEDYGVVAIAMPFVLFTMMFTDAGIGQSLMRAPREDETVWSTSFWLTIALGFALALAVALAAPAAALIYGEPRLCALILALALVVPAQAAATIPEAWLRLGHRFGTIAATEAAAIALSLATAVTVALKGGGAWALIAQQIALYGGRFALTFAFSGLRPRLRFALAGVREHLIFGRAVFSANFAVTLSQSLDSLLIGRILGPAWLGFYAMAFLFVRLPLRAISGPLEYVLYAHIAPAAGDTAALRRAFLLFTRLLATLLFPAIGMVAAAHDQVFRLLLSEKWAPAGDLFMLAAPAAALQAVSAFAGAFMMALNRPGIPLRLNTEFCLVLIAALLAFSWFGIAWAVFGYACSVFVYFPRLLALVLPQLECPASAYMRTLAAPAAVAIACVLAWLDASRHWALGDWQQLFAAGGVAVLGIAAGALLQFPALRVEMRLLWKKDAPEQAVPGVASV